MVCSVRSWRRSTGARALVRKNAAENMNKDPRHPKERDVAAGIQYRRTIIMIFAKASYLFIYLFIVLGRTISSAVVHRSKHY
jgi:hypothetical protein